MAMRFDAGYNHNFGAWQQRINQEQSYNRNAFLVQGGAKQAARWETRPESSHLFSSPTEAEKQHQAAAEQAIIAEQLAKSQQGGRGLPPLRGPGTESPSVSTHSIDSSRSTASTARSRSTRHSKASRSSCMSQRRIIAESRLKELEGELRQQREDREAMAQQIAELRNLIETQSPQSLRRGSMAGTPTQGRDQNGECLPKPIPQSRRPLLDKDPEVVALREALHGPAAEELKEREKRLKDSNRWGSRPVDSNPFG